MRFSALASLGAAPLLLLLPTLTHAQTGNTQGDSILPTSSTATTFTFLAAPTSKWFKAVTPTPPSFRYDILSSNREFTRIADFPTGFGTSFVVKTSNITIGAFLPGQSCDFLALLGGGVTNITISTINPGSDPASATSFPLKLDLGTSTGGHGSAATADFMMTAIPSSAAPEPGSLALLGLGALGGVSVIRQRGR